MIDVAEIAIRRVNDLPDDDRNRILNMVFSLLSDVDRNSRGFSRLFLILFTGVSIINEKNSIKESKIV